MQGSAAFLGTLAIGAPAVLGQATARPRVVVVGGGAGGTTAAKYIAQDSGGAIDVVLVEERANYKTCFFSNHYLGGFRNYDSLVFSYDKLASVHGVKLVYQHASHIDRDRKRVMLADGSKLDYDRLVVSPGIDMKYDSVPGWGREAEELMPHAFKPGKQTQILKARLDAVPDGGLIVILAPPDPSRCPPAPYERVSMMAYALKNSGRKRTKIIVLDPKTRFTKMALFLEGWEKYYTGMVEWLSPDIHDGVKMLDPKTGRVETGFETYDAALVNVIPAQMAGKIARDAQLHNETGFCPIDPATMKSRVDPAIFVLGDSCIAGDMPKSAFAANGQAKVAATAILSELTGASTHPAHYANICWSLLFKNDCVKLSGSYEPAGGKIKQIDSAISQLAEPAKIRAANYEEAVTWYDAITEDMFG